MAIIKLPTTYKQQIEKLRLRGCIIAGENLAEHILSKVNYYRLTAYFLPFKQPDETYATGTDLNKVYQIYEFDRKMRHILFSATEEIEINLRSTLAYFHAQTYGALGYLDKKNYYPKHNHAKFLSRIDGEKEKRKDEPFVKHHNNKYGGIFPIWAAIELFTFSTLSHFYADLPVHDQKNIARNFFNTHNKTLKSWLRCSTDLRNFCAHFGRLYFRIFTSIPDGIPEIDRWNERSLFASIMVLRNLFTDTTKWNNEIHIQICSLINEYSENIQLSHIGFPADWKIKLKR